MTRLVYRRGRTQGSRSYRARAAGAKFRAITKASWGRLLGKRRRMGGLERIAKGYRRTYSKYTSQQAEKKLVGITERNKRTPIAIQSGAIASYRGFVMGSKPSAWSGTWDDMNGIVIPKGDNEYNRNGQYVYLKHSNVFFNLDCGNQTTFGCVQEFRVLVFRARRQVNPTGVYYNPSTAMFLNDTGAPIGHETAGVNGTDLMFRMTNKRDFIIKHDRRFCLSPVFVSDSDGGGVRASGNYPVYKNFRFKLPYNKKTRYSTSDLPEDCPYHWGILVYSRSIGKNVSTVGQSEMNMRGNTVFLDP